MIAGYGYRFKIEVAFKQALQTLGTSPFKVTKPHRAHGKGNSMELPGV
jgi:hypothetical protein